MCFVFIWKQTATCTTYNINWLVFITEMKSVYSAVRTGSLNKTVCALRLVFQGLMANVVTRKWVAKRNRTLCKNVIKVLPYSLMKEITSLQRSHHLSISQYFIWSRNYFLWFPKVIWKQRFWLSQKQISIVNRQK